MPIRKPPLVKGRYDMSQILDRIEHLRHKRRLQRKDIAISVGISEAQFSKKMRQHLSTFTLEEIGAIADVLEAPPGWPFLDTESTDLLAAVQAFLAKRG